MTKSIIKVNNLSKTFIFHKKAEGLKGSLKAIFKRKKEEKKAVKNINFSINKGEFVGFLGPNGAGKTTTLKMLSGILYPTEGSITVAGHTPQKRENEFKKKISIVMGQKSQLWPVLPAIETFTLMQKMYEIPQKKYRKKLDELTELMDVKDILNIQVRKLSLGQRMKCELIGSLLHDPKILFLDEPTIGLDIISQKKVREFLVEYNKKNNTTIMLTSHNMDDVQNLCERLIIINKGELGYDGLIENIVSEYSKDKNLQVVFKNKVLKKDLAQIGKITKYNQFEVELSIPITESSHKIGKLISKFPVKDINVNDVTLEEIIEKIFKK